MKLSEDKITEQMGISRTPVREALRQLAAAGFVKMNPNQAIIVNDISIKGLREVLQIRGVLEGLAVPLITEEKIKVLETCNENRKNLLAKIIS